MNRTTYTFGFIDKSAKYFHENFFCTKNLYSVKLMILEGDCFIATPESGHKYEFTGLADVDDMVSTVIENSSQKIKLEHFKESIRKILECDESGSICDVNALAPSDRIVKTHGIHYDCRDYGFSILNSMFCYRCIFDEDEFEIAFARDENGSFVGVLDCDPVNTNLVFIKQK